MRIVGECVCVCLWVVIVCVIALKVGKWNHHIVYIYNYTRGYLYVCVWWLLVGIFIKSLNAYLKTVWECFVVVVMYNIMLMFVLWASSNYLLNVNACPCSVCVENVWKLQPICGKAKWHLSGLLFGVSTLLYMKRREWVKFIGPAGTGRSIKSLGLCKNTMMAVSKNVCLCVCVWLRVWQTTIIWEGIRLIELIKIRQNYGNDIFCD